MPSNTDNQNTTKADSPLIFPYTSEVERLSAYSFYEKLFFGRHFEAFNVKIDNQLYTREYAKLRYVMANFAGLISKVAADLLFIEPAKLTVEDGDQKFLDALISENHLHVQNYESALQNSYFGDAIYKVRMGKRHPNDEKPTVIIEDTTPRIYFPTINAGNVRAEPIEKELAWTYKISDKTYLRKEIHEVGKVRNEVYLMNGNSLAAREDISILGDPETTDEVLTGIDRSLIIHIPNWKVGSRWNGISDYYDLEQLFYAINNRLTKNDNILDKHSDPILSLPEGILDEKGQVNRSKLNLIERPEGSNKDSDPQYITWNANLDAAFKQIDELVKILMMTSEISPDVLGMGEGQAQSGYALKLKLLRTLAKVQRKQLYYREGLIEALYVAQKLAKEHKLEVDGLKLTKEPVKPECKFGDGLPQDIANEVDTESKRIDAGLTTKVDSIMRLDDVDEDIAQKKAKAIDEEGKINMPTTNIGNNPFAKDNKTDTGNNSNTNPTNANDPNNPNSKGSPNNTNA